MLQLFLFFILHAQWVLGNTEKIIFLAPSNLEVPVEHPTLEDLQLEALSPQHWSLRTHIGAEFPTTASKYGQPSWYLLHNLQEGQRYEVRICWAATQPTSFRLETYDLSTVFETPDLITSLAQFSESRQPDLLDAESQKPSVARPEKKSKHTPKGASSTLLLQIFAAADYYTMNKTLMNDVPPVFVDIILDPYIYNVFPRSLLPTAVYIIILAIGGWHLAKYISVLVKGIGHGRSDPEKKKT
ncbi:uncharacterized protein LY89DRAFT_711636 [Mollisia scopiformis]|uniref:Uncharacterized protein n=1 Tax=Mollisia scopiformis TaxID=149040 RepID=A0A132B9T2_MOLSC|nr:uncharacterized protein LY89DRAFT_711636 [Mollisia scopiformis]KUJ08624.1 hypothetical protein LY89DRAFT_711636 [Mollisia scopiformis]